MRNKLVVTMLAALLVFGVAGAALAGSFGGFGMRGMGRDPGTMPAHGEELNVTDEQSSQIQAAMNARFEGTQALRTVLMQKMHELRMLLWQRTPDQASVEAKKAEVAELQKQISDISQEARDQMNTILTPEQLEKLGNMRGQRTPMRHGQQNQEGFGSRGRPR